MRLPWSLIFFRAYITYGNLQKIYDFLDYEGVQEKDSGFLTLKQDEAKPLILPPQYTLCGRVFKWYERSKYTSFGTVSLLDKAGNVTHQFYHGVSTKGEFVVAEYHKTWNWMTANSWTGKES